MDNKAFTGDFPPDEVEVGRSAVRSLTAANAHVERSYVQRLSAETVVASSSAFGAANATTLELKESSAGIAAGDYVRIENSRVFLLLAPRVSGTVNAVLTLPAAFALGAGYFFARSIASRLFGRRES